MGMRRFWRHPRAALPFCLSLLTVQPWGVRGGVWRWWWQIRRRDGHAAASRRWDVGACAVESHLNSLILMQPWTSFHVSNLCQGIGLPQVMIVLCRSTLQAASNRLAMLALGMRNHCCRSGQCWGCNLTAAANDQRWGMEGMTQRSADRFW